ncbi:MAG: TolC family protein [Bacteroidetes bacterium]|jgi:outer membrane protein|nr:TolC family protein [Bacteroidota bacterium]
MKRFFVIIPILLLALAQAQTGELFRFSLEDCIQYALEHQPMLNRSRLAIDARQKDVNEVIATGLPQINGSVQAQNNLVIPTTIIPAGVFGADSEEQAVRFGTRYNVTAGVSVEQLILDGTYFLGVKAAKQYVELSRIQYNRTQRDVRVAVAKAYYSVLVNGQRIQVLAEQRKGLKQLLEDTRKLYQNELTEELDVNRIEVNYNNLETELEKARGLVLLSQVLLKFQMGMPAEDTLLLVEEELSSPLQFAQDTLQQLDYTSHIEHKELQQSMRLTELNEKRYRTGYYPSLSAFGNFQYQNLGDEFARNENWFGAAYIGAGLSIPIFDGLRKRAQIQRTRIERMQLEYDMRNLENSLYLEFRQARINYINAQRQLEIQARNRDLGKRVYDNTRLKYQQGIGSNLEVVQAEADYNQSQTNYFNSLLETYIARIDLQKALGEQE